MELFFAKGKEELGKSQVPHTASRFSNKISTKTKCNIRDPWNKKAFCTGGGEPSLRLNDERLKLN